MNDVVLINTFCSSAGGAKMVVDICFLLLHSEQKTSKSVCQ